MGKSRVKVKQVKEIKKVRSGVSNAELPWTCTSDFQKLR